MENDEINDIGLPKHAYEENHSFDYLGAKILHQEPWQMRRRLLEAIAIEQTPHTCNQSKGTHIDTMWTPLLNHFEKK